MSVMGRDSWADWISEYSRGHQNPINRACHTAGIPLIALSIPIFIAASFFPRLWPLALTLFGIGWVFQFAGHCFERNFPEFFKDPRFLLVGLRWWFAKIRGKA
jgi:uncharacterized membrane protein YGL010W